MHLKSAILTGLTEEEVYVRQVQGFESHKNPCHTFKPKKVLCYLRLLPRSSLDRFTNRCKHQKGVKIQD